MAVKINTGNLRFPIALKEPTEGVNDEGGRTLSYDSGVRVLASVREVNQNRNADTTTSITDGKDFYIRWSEDRDAINKDWLINYKGQDYTINEVEKIEELKMFIRIRGKVRG